MRTALLILAAPIALALTLTAWMMGLNALCKRLGFDVSSPWFPVGLVTSYLVLLYLISQAFGL